MRLVTLQSMASSPLTGDFSKMEGEEDQDGNDNEFALGFTNRTGFVRKKLWALFTILGKT